MSIPITLVSGALSAHLLSSPIGLVGGAVLNATNETITYLITPLFKEPSIPTTKFLTISATYTLMSGMGFTMPVRDLILLTITSSSVYVGCEWLADNAISLLHGIQAAAEVIEARERVTKEL